MDLSKLAISSESTSTMEVVHPGTLDPLVDDQGKPVTISVYSPESEQMKDFERSMFNKAVKKMRQRRNQNSMDYEQIQSTIVDRAVAATAGWENIAFDGKELACNPKNARMLYTKISWIKNQVIDFLNDEGNFMTGS